VPRGSLVPKGVYLFSGCPGESDVIRRCQWTFLPWGGFSRPNEVVLAILKRDKMESLDRVFVGAAVTNLGRLDVPTTYGALELDRLIMHPGGAFPLANVNLVVGAVTARRSVPRSRHPRQHPKPRPTNAYAPSRSVE